MQKLDIASLRTLCDPTQFEFETTAEIEDLDAIVGQERALAAIRFGIGIGGVGFNIFAMGPSGIGKHHVLTTFLDEHAPTKDTPASWCYVHNFEDPQAPRAIALAAGRATEARDAVGALLGEIEVAVRTVIEGEDFGQRRRHLHAEFDARHDGVLDAVALAADTRDLSLDQTNDGFVIVPLIDGERATPDQVADLSEEERERIETARVEVEGMLRGALDEFPTWERERRHALIDLQSEAVGTAVSPLFERLRADFSDSAEFVDHLTALEQSLIADPSPFIAPDEDAAAFEFPHSLGVERFDVNVMVDYAPGHGAPVVYQDDPTWENLHGRVEYDAGRMGLTTNFALIRAGSLHRANNGYLIVDARKLLADPQSWSELKRTLYAEEIRVPSRTESAMAPRALSLDPDPIPLSVKVILVGERDTYYALRELDPDMDELFKVMADFDTYLPRTDATVREYACFIATIVRDDGLRPFDRGAVARVVEEGARVAQHAERLSTHMRMIADLLRASDYCAATARAEIVTATHVAQALREERERNGRIRDGMLEEVTSELINVATDGEAVGEINGLSVMQFGSTRFGRASRITVAVSPGRELIDIEREADLGGPIHTKGIMLLSGFLAHRFGGDAPLALSATIAFEQSYGPIDGDSASVAETCALLSALAGVELKQSFATTGAIDQRGRVQAVGGVDAKIEGWFDVCQARGLTGKQGAIIPAINVPALMLQGPVLDAVREGTFSIWAVKSVDEAMSLLTGRSVEEIDRRVRGRLEAFADSWAAARPITHG